MLPPETYKSEIGSQPTMCQLHTGTYVSLLAPERSTLPLVTQERLSRVHCTQYTYARQTQVNREKKQRKERKGI